MATFIPMPSGRTRARVRKRGGREVSKTFATKSAARAWAAQQEGEIESGTWVNTTRADSFDFGELMEEYKTKVLGARRSAEKTATWTKLFIEDFGHYRLTAVTAPVIAEWRDRRLGEVKPGSVLRELGFLGGFFTWVMKQKMIPLPANPVSNIARPSAPAGRNRRLKEGEEQWIRFALQPAPRPSGGTRRQGNYMRGTRNPVMEKVMLFALETGMRQGEIAALDRVHVDLKTQVAHLPTSKNGDARNIPLSAKATQILRDLGIEDDREGTVFRVTAEAIKRSWKRTIIRARELYLRECAEQNAKPIPGFLEGITFHDLRHEATSRLAGKLPNLIELASVTGHRDLRMLKRYYHPKAEELAKKLG